MGVQVGRSGGREWVEVWSGSVGREEWKSGVGGSREWECRSEGVKVGRSVGREEFKSGSGSH